MNGTNHPNADPAVFASTPQVPPGWSVPPPQPLAVTFAAAPTQSHGVAMVMMPGGGARDALGAVLSSVGFSLMAFESPLAVASHLYGVRPSVVLVDSASGPTMASQVVAWLRLAGIQSPVVLMGPMAPALTEQMTRAGVNHCVPYPSDLAVFAVQVVVATHANGAGPVVAAPLNFSSVTAPR